MSYLSYAYADAATSMETHFLSAPLTPHILLHKVVAVGTAAHNH